MFYSGRGRVLSPPGIYLRLSSLRIFKSEELATSGSFSGRFQGVCRRDVERSCILGVLRVSGKVRVRLGGY